LTLTSHDLSVLASFRSSYRLSGSSDNNNNHNNNSDASLYTPVHIFIAQTQAPRELVAAILPESQLMEWLRGRMQHHAGTSMPPFNRSKVPRRILS